MSLASPPSPSAAAAASAAEAARSAGTTPVRCGASRSSEWRLSAVESVTVRESEYADAGRFGDERVQTVVVDNFPALGKLTALRFIEWAQANPGGVVSLPTGKTPEYFIKWVTRILNEWGEPAVVDVLDAHGVASGPDDKPDMWSMTFVQIDEFFPIAPQQSNSFHAYVSSFYIRGMGFDPAKALLIDGAAICDMSVFDFEAGVDLSLRLRAPASEAECARKAELVKVDEWCAGREAEIRARGGIGFFLGGIGPDGHIAFNCSGSDHYSTTRLSAVNYETQAASAGDLGGIEVASKRLVITIGLGTITFNPLCTAIIIAAGEAKASIVAASLTSEPTVSLPATVLHALPNARFYITDGAAKSLPDRELFRLANLPEITMYHVELVLVDLCIKTRTELLKLTAADLESDARAQLVVERYAAAEGASAGEMVPELALAVFNSLVDKIEAGLRTYDSTRFLHTEPHHDDVMLGYWSGVMRQTRNPTNVHKFACATSGFNSVTNSFMIDILKLTDAFLDTPEFASLSAEDHYFDPSSEAGRNRDVWQYLDGVAADSESGRHSGMARRFIRNLIDIYSDSADVASLRKRISVLLYYFETQYDGQKNTPDVQLLKGYCREYEADVLWGWLGWEAADVYHARLKFYSANIFDEEPEVTRDVLPLVEHLRDVDPDIVTLALDPEASGPDTHYKVLQALTTAMKMYQEEAPREIKVWGYRNVWFTFHPADANMFIPVTLADFASLNAAFVSSYATQRDASFPSYMHNGPFSELAQAIQQRQYAHILKLALGRNWFHSHPEPLIRATRGFVFLKEMTLHEFYEQSRALKSATEARASPSRLRSSSSARRSLTPGRSMSHDEINLSRGSGRT